MNVDFTSKSKTSRGGTQGQPNVVLENGLSFTFSPVTEYKNSHTCPELVQSLLFYVPEDFKTEHQVTYSCYGGVQYLTILYYQIFQQPPTLSPTILSNILELESVHDLVKIKKYLEVGFSIVEKFLYVHTRRLASIFNSPI